MPASPAARPDAIRRHNLALVLEHVHRDGALTRAELTHRLAVSRSTVGALVADLIARPDTPLTCQAKARILRQFDSAQQRFAAIGSATAATSEGR